MKNNLFLYFCLGLLIACNSGTNTNGEATEVITLKNNDTAAVQTEADTGIIVEETYAGAGTFETMEQSESQQNVNATPADAEPVANTDAKSSPAPAEAIASTETPATPQAKSEEDSKPAAQSEAKQTPAQAITIVMGVVPDMMQFDKEEITVKAGQKVTIELENTDGMQHNMLIIKPGTLDKVGAAADALARDPKGAQIHYVPKMPEVLFATKLLNPEEVVTLTFTAPSQPGDYPFVCTFPGHWRMMNGIMKVTK